MKTKQLPNGNIKVWFTREEEFKIINKNAPLIDTVIDSSLKEKKFGKFLVSEIQNAGYDDIHGVFIDLDDTMNTYVDTYDIQELEYNTESFNTIFSTNYKFHKNSNGKISIILKEFETYDEFRRDYFLTFFLKLFIGQIDLELSVVENPEYHGLTDFLNRFVPENYSLYLETSKAKDFSWVIKNQY